MSASEVRERLAALREAGASLRTRPAGDVIDALAAVLDRWRDPEGRERRELERALPTVTGFSAPNVKEGLALALEPWTGSALRDVTRRAFTSHGGDPRGHDTTGVILAGSIPMPTLSSILEPLALRSPVLVKTAARDPLTARLVARSIAAVDPALGDCVGVVDFARADEDAMDAFLAADLIVATGSDETVDAVTRRAEGRARVVAHGHRLSIAVLGPGASRDAELAEAARGIALDAALWDQLGCLSPVVVFAPDRARFEVGTAIAESFAAIEARLPRGEVAPRGEALALHERSGAELRAAAGREVAVHTGADGAWTVIVEDDDTPRPMPLHRFLRIHPANEMYNLQSLLEPYVDHLAGVAIAGFDEGATLHAPLSALGASRICRPGSLQTPPLDWPRDGHAAFTSLARTNPA